MTAPTALGFVDLLDVLDFTPSEFVALLYEDVNGVPRTAIVALVDAGAAFAAIPADVNAYFGVSPVKGPASNVPRRGVEEDVTRLSALVADIDIGKDKCPTRDIALAVIAEIGIILGTRASIIVDSGHGLHAYWPLSDGQVTDIGATRALLRRFKRLVAHVATKHGSNADSVFAVNQMMRLPETNNCKRLNGEKPIPVTAQRYPGGPLTVGEVDERLEEYGIEERGGDRDATDGKEVSSPNDWTFADDDQPARRTCAYVTTMIDSWVTDRPKPGGSRNHFVYDRYIRLFCAYRAGCITADDYQRARQILVDLLAELVSTIDPRRKVRRFETADFNKHGIAKVAAKTDEQVGAELGDHHRDDSWAQPAQQLAPLAPPTPLADALDVFKRWLHIDDTAPVLVVAAAVVANVTAGEPVWLLVVGPSSGGKTEIVVTCLGLPYNVVSAAVITEAALLSGTAKRDRSKTATGGLMRQIGGFGILLAKDFTSVLSQNRDTAKAAMAALREVYDGRWDRPVGVDGGKTLTWQGKCGFIGGVTPSYDRYSVIVNTLGDRFLLLRMPEVDAAKQAAAALKAAQHEQQMRTELTAAMHGLINGADHARVAADLADAEAGRLTKLAVYAARARTGVERDGYTGELQVIPLAEGPARLVKELRQLYGALAAIGVDDGERWSVLARIARDCAPAIRTKLIRVLVGSKDWRRTSDIAEDAGLVTKTAARHLDDLALLGLAERRKQPKTHKKQPKTGDEPADNSPYQWGASAWLRANFPR